jgi:hypothetical protein
MDFQPCRYGQHGSVCSFGVCAFLSVDLSLFLSFQCDAMGWNEKLDGTTHMRVRKIEVRARLLVGESPYIYTVRLLV